MTDPIRDAAQALLHAFDVQEGRAAADMGSILTDEQTVSLAAAHLRAALSAPQPVADERVKERMRRVEASTTAHNLARYALDDFIVGKLVGGFDVVNTRCAEAADALAAVESSARALLSAGRDDAGHAAMYRWIREQNTCDSWPGFERCTEDQLDAAIRAAMQKGTP